MSARRDPGDRQRKGITITAAEALAVGLVLAFFLARLLPFGLDGRLAATIMGADRWDAGAGLMTAQSPEAWRALMDAGKLTAANSEALGACREAALKAKKDQRCIIVVSVQ